LPWAECFAAHGSLRVLVLWSGARALFCLPLLRVEQDGQRRLGWLGEGSSDYLDALVAPEAEPPLIDAVWAALGELESEVDRIELGDVPAGSPLLRRGVPGWRLQQAAICPKLEPGFDLASFERTLPAWLLRNLRRSERRLNNQGALHWHGAVSEDVGACVEELFALHAARWSAREEAGVLAHPSVQTFHRAAAPRLLARGLLQLELAISAGRTVAAAYTLIRRHAYLYLNGFDPNVEGVSLGSLIIARAIRRAIAERREVVDFLRGQEPYKYAWGVADTRTFRLLRSVTSTQAARGATGSDNPSSCWRTKSA